MWDDPDIIALPCSRRRASSSSITDQIGGRRTNDECLFGTFRKSIIVHLRSDPSDSIHIIGECPCGKMNGDIILRVEQQRRGVLVWARSDRKTFLVLERLLSRVLSEDMGFGKVQDLRFSQGGHLA